MSGLTSCVVDLLLLIFFNEQPAVSIEICQSVHPLFKNHGMNMNDCRGPAYGYRGKVVLAFEENGSSKIGVRFDKSIPEGNDLGGLCDDDHGFFCAGIV